MEVLHPVCCGLDVHSKTVVACLNVHGKKTTRTFSTMTDELLKLADWLLDSGCPIVAIESTGVYWKPIYNVLEGVCEVWLVNAHHVRNVPGRKTDAKDCDWLSDLLRHGLVRPSFIPPAPIRDLRELTRYRTTLVRDRTQIANRIVKVAESGNVKLASVLSDPLGGSGRRMLRAVAEGERDLDRIVELADRQLEAKRGQLRRALDHRMTPAQRFVLKELLARYEEVEGAITRVSEAIAREVASEQQDPFVAEAKRLLMEVTGIGERVAEVILSEIGTDMSRFPSAAHLSSWAGLCPGNNESGGKRRSGKTTKGNRALKTALTQAAWAASRTKGSFLALRYQQLKQRLGAKRAIVAIAHKILVMLYQMLSTRAAYREPQLTPESPRAVETQRARLVAQLARLGFKVTVEEVTDIEDAA
jgi:transposase